MQINDEITPELDRIRRELERFRKMTIHVGIQGISGKNEQGGEVGAAPADLLTIAGVHEFGATIKAKHVRNLAIPIAKKARGKSPRDFPGLFFLIAESGCLYGCISRSRKGKSRPSGTPRSTEPKAHRPTGKPVPKKKDDIEFLFILLPSVNIPERSFIRKGYDENKDNLETDCFNALQGILFRGWDADKAANHIGMKAVGYIQTYLNTPGNFRPKSAVTKATSNWADNPLIESGRLRNSITYVITGGD